MEEKEAGMDAKVSLVLSGGPRGVKIEATAQCACGATATAKSPDLWFNRISYGGPEFHDEAHRISMPEGWDCWGSTVRCPACYAKYLERLDRQKKAKEAREAARIARASRKAVLSDEALRQELEKIAKDVAFDNWHSMEDRVRALAEAMKERAVA